eukprot:TRINITY_DN29107_c0_g1_i1.p1 TRINITY_DN29107_c0_g1~~TRINITY_DN29107_c0_g1_i1.p1  ORF type:complete len:529 (-),score=86.82 TRINITY_DN29107_c0_g1_i1:96-1682(-)
MGASVCTASDDSTLDLTDLKNSSPPDRGDVVGPANPCIDRAGILKSRSQVHQIEESVLQAKFLLYQESAMVEENRNLILENYLATFVGNRQTAVQNLDKVLQNRESFLMACVSAQGPVRENYMNAMINECRIEQEEAVSRLNASMAECNDKLTAINASLIGINTKICNLNGLIVKFNTEQLAINDKLLSGGLADSSTRAAVFKRVESSLERISVLKANAQQASSNSQLVQANLKKGREAILKENLEIYERRKEIVGNHDAIREEAKHLVDMLVPVVEGRAGNGRKSLKMADNSEKIFDHRAKIIDLCDVVLHNKFLVFEERSMIEENRALILQNYASTWKANHVMANQDTDQIFRHRESILRALETARMEDPIIEALIHEARVDFSEHRSSINEKVQEINTAMFEINDLLLEINETIMKFNASIVTHVKKQLGITKDLMDHGVQFEGITPETNAKLIKSNVDRMAIISIKSDDKCRRLAAILRKVQENRGNISKNAEAIQDRRNEITAIHQKVLAASEKLVDFYLKAV